MKKLIVATAVYLLACHPVRAATFERVQEALIGWHYTYEAVSIGHQVPIYFTLRQCSAPTVVAAQGYSPLAQCFRTEAEARPAAQQWANKEELRYRDIQDPSPGAIKAMRRLWQKVRGE